MSRRSTVEGARADRAWDPISVSCAALGDRLLRRIHRRMIGLWPIRGAATLPLAVRLASSVARLRGEPAAAVSTHHGGPPSDTAPSAAQGMTHFGRTALEGGRVDLWSPRRPVEPREIDALIEDLRRIIETHSRQSVAVFVDLAGLLQLGRHLDAIDSLGGIFMVARAGRTRERDLLKARGDVASEKLLGVVLVDR